MDIENNNVEKKMDLFGSFKGSTAASTGSGKPGEKQSTQVGETKPTSIAFKKPTQPTTQRPAQGTVAAPKPVTQVQSSMSSGKPVARTGSESNKKVFVCIKCGYKFSIDVSKYKKIDCPWCATEQPVQKNY